jgi:hypothetical protein
MAKLEKIEPSEHGPDYAFFCVGCQCSHGVWTTRSGHPVWDFNGDLEKPTFLPSIRVSWPSGEENKENVCHSFIKDGRIQYLADCTHAFAGQIVDLPEIE